MLVYVHVTGMIYGENESKVRVEIVYLALIRRSLGVKSQKRFRKFIYMSVHFCYAARLNYAFGDFPKLHKLY